MLHVDPAGDAYDAELARSQLRYVTGSQARRDVAGRELRRVRDA